VSRVRLTRLGVKHTPKSRVLVVLCVELPVDLVHDAHTLTTSEPLKFFPLISKGLEGDEGVTEGAEEFDTFRKLGADLKVVHADSEADVRLKVRAAYVAASKALGGGAPVKVIVDGLSVKDGRPDEGVVVVMTPGSLGIEVRDRVEDSFSLDHHGGDGFLSLEEGSTFCANDFEFPGFDLHTGGSKGLYGKLCAHLAFTATFEAGGAMGLAVGV